MAAQVKHFACTIPANTAKATPVTIQMQLGVFEVAWVDLEVPPGPSGLVGFYIASSSQQVIPYNPGPGPNWLILNNRNKHWDLEDQPNSGDWQLVGYNTDVFAHTIYVTWGLNNIEPAPAPLVLLPAAALSSG